MTASRRTTWLRSTCCPTSTNVYSWSSEPKQDDIEGVEAEFEDLKEVRTGATLAAGSFGFYRGETVPQEEGGLYDPLVPHAAVTARRGRNAMRVLDGYMHYAVDYTDSEVTHNPWERTGSRWATFFYPTVKT